MHALITGASGAIGGALAEQLAARGHRVSLVARRGDRLRDLAGRLPTETFVREADLSESAVVPGLLADVTAALGPVDVLVNNAGVQFVEPGAEVSEARIHRLLAVNLSTPLVLMQQVLPSMETRGAGAVVNISSMAGLTPTPWMAHYSASKAGLAAASEALRVELRGSGVQVLTVYPGPVESEMEAAARAQLSSGLGSWLAPQGTPGGLARAVMKGLDRGRARVVYPRAYRLGRHLRGPSQWLVDHLTPRPRSD